jgi:uncharacterized protein involved in response to NO
MPLANRNAAAGAAEGFALFQLGFRPFYLLAGIYATLSVALWGLEYAGWLPGAGFLWHAHEMLFGYTFAVITGFLFTAVRNWTGLPTPAGVRLALIAGVWIAARVLAPFSWRAAALADAAFALGVAWGIARPLIASGNRRNLFFVVLVIAFGFSSATFRFWPDYAWVVGLDLVLFIISVVAGRVVPMFTNNAVPGAGARRLRLLETGALGSVLALLLADVLKLQLLVAVVAIIAALLHATRLALWAPLRTRGRPIVWILHLSYAWIVVHLALRGLAGFGMVAPAVATHALTVGAIGGLTLGMMTRTARGHTARSLAVGRAEVAAYVLVHAAALTRVGIPLVAPQWYRAGILASALLWAAAFLIFTVTYFPILTRPRLDGRPG